MGVTRIQRIITVLIMMVMMIEVFRSEKEKLRVRSVSGSAVGTWSLARRRRITRCCLGLNIMLLFLLFLSWVCQPTCCDTLTVISSFSPQLQYVNGPPPI